MGGAVMQFSVRRALFMAGFSQFAWPHNFDQLSPDHWPQTVRHSTQLMLQPFAVLVNPPSY